MARVVVLHHQTQPSFSVLTSSLSDFYGTSLVHSHLQFNRKGLQPKRAFHVAATSQKKILIMGGTRFIGVLLSRLPVKEGHQQVTLFTRVKAPITQHCQVNQTRIMLSFLPRYIYCSSAGGYFKSDLLPLIELIQRAGTRESLIQSPSEINKV